MKKRIQTRLTAVLTALLLTTAFSAQAQNTSENQMNYPYAFIGLQGGGQTTFTNYNNWELITPTASVYVGVHFVPTLAARLHFNGIWNKSGISKDDIEATFKYKYFTSDLDLMFNVVRLFCKKPHKLNAYLIGGVGLNYAWNNEDVPALRKYISTSESRNRLSHNFRVGAMLDLNVARNWSVNLEVAGNSLSDRYNSKYTDHDDWQLTAQLGVTYKFGIRHKVKEAPKSNIIVAPATIGTETETASANTNVEIEKPEPAPVPAPAPVVKDITRNIFFSLRQTEVTPAEQAKVKEVADWLKEHPSAKVTITGYADKKTGTADINSRLAKQRAESVTKLFTKKYGIEASRITTSSKGDTVQPFPSDNEKNRVTIVVGKE